MASPIQTSIALRMTPLTEKIVARMKDSGLIDPVLHEVKPIHRAFAPMVNEAAFDISELAIVTALQAIEHAKPIVPLPITVSARFQHKCIVQNGERNDIGPADLKGQRVAVRAFSQTTGSWVRTILEQEYGVATRDVEWVTEEPPHVREATEPANVVRDPEGRTAYELLKSGAVAAAIFGNDMPREDWIRPVIPTPDAAAMESFRSRGVVPINHVLALSRSFFDACSGLVPSILSICRTAKEEVAEPDQPDLLPMGIEALRPSIEALLASAAHQGLTSRHLGVEEIFGESAKLVA